MYILLVDAQPLMRRGIKDVLSLNYERVNIDEVSRSDTAISQLSLNTYQIVIIDIYLEGERSFSLIERMKVEYPKTKILIMTSSNNILDFEHAKKLKVDGYILKSAFVEDFLYAFQVVIRGENFFFSKILEKSMNGEPKELKRLTNREKEVFEELSKGRTNAQISHMLYITEATTKKHIGNILGKLNLSNRIEVVFYAKKLYES